MIPDDGSTTDRDNDERTGRVVLRSLDVTDEQPGFRPRRTLDDSPEAAREVRQAIARAKEGDREAVRLLYVRYADNVYGYVRSIVRDEKEAEDLTQQVFMKLMLVIGKYTDCGVPFSGWLLRLARNVALDHLRRRRPTPTEDVVALDTHADESGRESARDLYAALATLPDEQRDVIVMRHIVGLSPPEIAEQMGRSESSIHGLHHRGRRALKQELARLGSAPMARLAC
jgi:RNA polymerase sigma-70 factor (ECF subfamily)